MAKHQENYYYMLQLFDKMGNQIAPFGRINYLVLPRIEQNTGLNFVPNTHLYIPYMTDFSASYEGFERNEGAKSFLAYFSYEPNLNKTFCGSIFYSNPMKMLAYFDDAFIKSLEINPDKFGGFTIDFCFMVNDFEYCDGFIR